jgi:hypothetical protein
MFFWPYDGIAVGAIQWFNSVGVITFFLLLTGLVMAWGAGKKGLHPYQLRKMGGFQHAWEPRGRKPVLL